MRWAPARARERSVRSNKPCSRCAGSWTTPTCTNRANDNTIGASTAYHYLHEAIDVLAVRTPDVHDAPIHTDRVAMRGPNGADLWWSTKHKQHGGNIHVLSCPDGFPCRVSDVRPGRERGTERTETQTTYNKAIRAVHGPAAGTVAPPTQNGQYTVGQAVTQWYITSGQNTGMPDPDRLRHAAAPPNSSTHKDPHTAHHAVMRSSHRMHESDDQTPYANPSSASISISRL